MEHGGRLPANCALTVYYLPVYPPYSDYNYGLRGVDSSPQYGLYTPIVLLFNRKLKATGLYGLERIARLVSQG
jgi:hypothetical protein